MLTIQLNNNVRQIEIDVCIECATKYINFKTYDSIEILMNIANFFVTKVRSQTSF
jgi:hypothetical protein